MLYYLHIPKSAGISVRELFRRTYGEKLIEIYRDMDDAYAESLKPVCHPDSVFFGHFGFSLHVRLGDNDAQYMTVIRHPVERVISWYKWVSRRPESAQYERIHRDGLTLAEAVQLGVSTEVNNHTVRMLAGNCLISQAKQRAMDYLSARLLRKEIYQYEGKRYLDTAIANLNNYFCFVGIMERLDQLPRFLIERGDVAAENASVPMENVAPPMDVRIDSQTLDVIRKGNELDLMLYEHIAGKIKRGEAWYPVKERSRSLVTRFHVARLGIARPPNAGKVDRGSLRSGA